MKTDAELTERLAALPKSRVRLMELCLSLMERLGLTEARNSERAEQIAKLERSLAEVTAERDAAHQTLRAIMEETVLAGYPAGDREQTLKNVREARAEIERLKAEREAEVAELGKYVAELRATVERLKGERDASVEEFKKRFQLWEQDRIAIVTRANAAKAELERLREALRITPEEVGRIMHESWSKTKRAQHYHHPEEACDLCSGPGAVICPTHRDLVPWEKLPEAQKDINRHAFDAVLVEIRRRAATAQPTLSCKHCLEPIRDNGTVYVHTRHLFTKGKHLIFESQWCNEEERTHMAEAAAALGADEALR